GGPPPQPRRPRPPGPGPGPAGRRCWGRGWLEQPDPDGVRQGHRLGLGAAVVEGQDAAGGVPAETHAVGAVLAQADPVPVAGPVDGERRRRGGDRRAGRGAAADGPVGPAARPSPMPRTPTVASVRTRRL